MMAVGWLRMQQPVPWLNVDQHALQMDVLCATCRSCRGGDPLWRPGRHQDPAPQGVLLMYCTCIVHLASCSMLLVAYCHAMLDAVMLSFLLLGHTGYTAEGAWRVHPGVHQVAISTASARLPLNQLLLRLDHGPTRSIVVSTITENMELV